MLISKWNTVILYQNSKGLNTATATAPHWIWSSATWIHLLLYFSKIRLDITPNHLHPFLVSPIWTTPTASHILLGFTTRTLLGDQNKSRSSSYLNCSLSSALNRHLEFVFLPQSKTNCYTHQNCQKYCFVYGDVPVNDAALVIGSWSRISVLAEETLSKRKK